MKWSQLPDKLTTEQVIEFASNMSDGEDVAVSTPITDFLLLEVSMGNKPLESVNACLFLEEIEGMRGFLPLSVLPVSASSGGVFTDEPEESELESIGAVVSQEANLNIHDVIKLFRLGDSARWEITNHGAMIGG